MTVVDRSSCNTCAIRSFLSWMDSGWIDCIIATDAYSCACFLSYYCLIYYVLKVHVCIGFGRQSSDYRASR